MEKKKRKIEQTFLKFYKPEADKNEKLNEMFEIFWKEHPKKVAKAYVKKIFKRIISRNIKLFPIIMKALKKQKTSFDWTKDKGEFIPNPSTWLTQGRWDDELMYKESTAEMHARLKAKGEI